MGRGDRTVRPAVSTFPGRVRDVTEDRGRQSGDSGGPGPLDEREKRDLTRTEEKDSY